MEVEPFGIHVVVVQPGSIRSRFGEHATHGLERYHSDDSLYSPVAAAIDARARASQHKPSPPEQLARRVVNATLHDRPPAVVRYGANSLFVTSLRHLPSRLRDRFLSRRFGLDQLYG
jgi:short-subunit dehydrogenase